MNALISFVNDLLWGSVLIYFLLGAGLFFTLRLGFLQIRHFGHMFSILRRSRRSDDSGISSFQALCTSLAARVGTGNLAGVAVALTLGGPGAIFWMWVVAFIGMATAFVESTLAQLYKTKDDQGNYRGGPAYYMEKGLGMRRMGVLFSIFLIIAFGLVFNAVQSNSIAQAMHVAFGVPQLGVGIGLVVLTAVIIFGGVRTIARVAELIVPVMALVYLLLALYVVGINISKLPDVIALIVKSAFGWQEAAAGTLAYTISQAMINGVKRGLFSNEAGMGSAPNAAAAASPYPPHPASQGYVQMLGVFMDTIVICTATAAIILTSGTLETGQGMSGIDLTQRALSTAVGDWGAIFIAVAVFFFAFTSIIANYAYAETNLVFLEHNGNKRLLMFRGMVLGMVIFGAVAELPIVWAMADISMGLMALTNLIAILLLSGTAIKLAKDYNEQLDSGKLPVFDVRKYPELHSQLEPGIWDDPDALRKMAE
ncbi:MULTISPECIES: alanine/glycine:cation symporter family protein [Plesiomonas]|uniref:Sodium:alanine symporter family protein n=1 Tax=Plesiomonas shigelloides TaxID=703 RepID=A0A1A9B0P9_PLESH|nr:MULTISPECIES: sodium:alanine symporter family protein [Plesiomonas]MCE5162663.1 sodium:alanine symporter family protein [Plesiomonas sp. PI-19]MDO4687805.1 sodium:alanine symporter family protein [Plesiomonas sp.]AVQ88123.1 sodium:alanine symporter family protein [Plesiomonas shigelloides]KAB7655380.1 amino acid carrier protein [Plesiomonas shigelloides]KAB7667008.1 amino acid carrier protein [Plesiomonas shigelloides]